MNLERSKQREEKEKTAEVTQKWIYQGKIIGLRSDTLKIADHPMTTWDVVVHPGAVVIIPITDEGELILVKQWRRAVEKIILELPAGTLEEGESPASCADRELQEETGFKANSLIPLGGFYTAPGFCTEYLHLFLAKDLQPSSLPPDEGEAIDIVLVDLKRALEMIQDQTLCDAKTIAGILRYRNEVLL